MSHYVLGLDASGNPCPVCDLKPQAFRATSVEAIVECGRCGFPSKINPTASSGERIPQPLASPPWVEVFRRYYSMTGNKMTTPEVVGPDIELAGRMKMLNAWLEENRDFVGQMTIGTVAPYTSITAVVVRVANADGSDVRLGWQLLLPAEGIGEAIQIPIAAESFVAGTILTIQSPIVLPKRRT